MDNSSFFGKDSKWIFSLFVVVVLIILLIIIENFRKYHSNIRARKDIEDNLQKELAIIRQSKKDTLDFLDEFYKIISVEPDKVPDVKKPSLKDKIFRKKITE